MKSGSSARVVLAGLRFGEQLLDLARAMTVGSGVRIVPLWGTDEAGVDITVERAAEGTVADG